MIKEILFVEPFYGGSHKSWINQVIKHSKHNYDLLTLPDKFWKWRMYGAAIKLANEFIERNKVYDTIIFSDMIDLTTFLSLTRFKIPKETKIILYFHENQFAYPWKKDSEDIKEKRDIHYGFINYTSALAADQVLYNSQHNMESFLEGARRVLKSMPDARVTDTLKVIEDKSMVLPLGMTIPQSLKKEEREIPLLLWNHRWEFDKNPEDFLNTLMDLHDEGHLFHLALLGEKYKNSPEIFDIAKDKLKDIIVYEGYTTGQVYKDIMIESTIIPITSIHDFFGISIMEAISYGAIPLLPKRLAYPELYKPEEHPEIFYDDLSDFKNKLREMIKSHKTLSYTSYRALTLKYDWSKIITLYDETF